MTHIEKRLTTKDTKTTKIFRILFFVPFAIFVVKKWKTA